MVRHAPGQRRQPRKHRDEFRRHVVRAQAHPGVKGHLTERGRVLGGGVGVEKVDQPSVGLGERRDGEPSRASFVPVLRRAGGRGKCRRKQRAFQGVHVAERRVGHRAAGVTVHEGEVGVALEVGGVDGHWTTLNFLAQAGRHELLSESCLRFSPLVLGDRDVVVASVAQPLAK